MAIASIKQDWDELAREVGFHRIDDWVETESELETFGRADRAPLGKGGNGGNLLFKRKDIHRANPYILGLAHHRNGNFGE